MRLQFNRAAVGDEQGLEEALGGIHLPGQPPVSAVWVVAGPELTG